MRSNPLVLFGAGVMLAGALAACADAPTGVARAEQDLLEQIAALGYRTDMVEDRGDYFRVEGDIRLTKAYLRTLRPPDRGGIPGPSFQYHTTALVTNPGAVQTIKVDLSQLAGTNWEAPAREALQHWSYISDSYVQMVEGTPADITFVRTNEAWNVAGEADPPANGRPGAAVRLNNNFRINQWQIPSYAVYLRNVVHELGHTIGFRHTNWKQFECDLYYGDPRVCSSDPSIHGAVHIGGTPQSGGDAASVMNGMTANQAWNGFSNYDLFSVRAMYPLPGPANLTSSHPGTNAVLSWSPVPGALYYQMQYVEARQESDYERGNNYYEYTNGWGWPLYDTTADTGMPWTGVSYCLWYSSMYSTDESNFYFSVRAVFPNGVSKYVATIPAEVATC